MRRTWILIIGLVVSSLAAGLRPTRNVYQIQQIGHNSPTQLRMIYFDSDYSAESLRKHMLMHSGSTSSDTVQPLCKKKVVLESMKILYAVTCISILQAFADRFLNYGKCILGKHWYFNNSDFSTESLQRSVNRYEFGFA